jgi:hypothetical protein
MLEAVACKKVFSKRVTPGTYSGSVIDTGSWFVFWEGVESGGQAPRELMRCEVLVSSALLSRHHDEFYSN